MKTCFFSPSKSAGRRERERGDDSFIINTMKLEFTILSVENEQPGAYLLKFLFVNNLFLLSELSARFKWGERVEVK